MNSILADFFREHHQHEAWWYKIKITPKAASKPTQDALLPPDEAPGDFCISQLMGITMELLWDILFACNWARKKGKQRILVKEHIQDFIAMNNLADILSIDTKNKQLVLRVGVYSSTSLATDKSATSQWKSGKRPPRPL